MYTFNHRQPVLEATLQSSNKLLSSLLKKIGTISDDALHTLRATVSLALSSAHSLVLHNRTRSEDHRLSQAVMKIHTAISTWVAKQFPIAFQIESQHQVHYKMEELKVS